MRSCEHATRGRSLASFVSNGAVTFGRCVWLCTSLQTIFYWQKSLAKKRNGLDLSSGPSFVMRKSKLRFPVGSCPTPGS